MKCPKCGVENRAGAKFCARCGEALVEAAPQAEPAAPADTEPAEAPAAAPETIAPSEPVAAEVKPEPISPPAEPLVALPAPPERKLAPGEKLLGRYEIIELLSEDESGALYAAYDLLRCARCGFSGNEKGSEFCGQCGAALDQKARCQILQKPLIGEALIADQFSEGDFVYTVTLGQPETQPAQGAIAPSVSLRWGKKTDVGAKRDLNEDSLDVRVYSAAGGATLGLFIVADGVGGQEHGEVASKLAIEAVWAQVRDKLWKPEMTGEVVTAQMMETIAVEAAKEANLAIYKLRRERHNDMGATLTMALVRDTLAVIANVGDSRTYLWGAEGLKRISVDHSVVESLVASGEITREQVYSHPQRNLIYRSLGDRQTVDVDTFVQPLKPGDRLILCSDGLWEMARDEGIEEILMRESDPQIACDVLIDRANLAGGDDNITVIIVQVES